jgi:hypothetical protein
MGNQEAVKDRPIFSREYIINVNSGKGFLGVFGRLRRPKTPIEKTL